MMVKRLCGSIAITILFHSLLFVLPVSLQRIQQPGPLELFLLGEENAARDTRDKNKPPSAKAERKSRLRITQHTAPSRQKEKETTLEKQEVSAADSPPAETVRQTTEKPEAVRQHESAAADTQSTSAGEAGGPVNTAFGAADGPRFSKRVNPKYPFVAKRRGQEGSVLLRLTIDDDGRLRHAEIVETSGELFAQAALRAVKQSRFLPAQRGGKAVSCRVLLPVTFSLRR